jgi:hypothetical protein
MTQQDIDEAVAAATGESITLINDRGFGIADSLDVHFDPGEYVDHVVRYVPYAIGLQIIA